MSDQIASDRMWLNGIRSSVLIRIDESGMLRTMPAERDCLISYPTGMHREKGYGMQSEHTNGSKPGITMQILQG